MRVLALYLPQFHEVEENNKWWGDGYTEWTAVRDAKGLFKGHKQPVIPLDNNYYDLADESGKTWKWQADLAKKYKVYGFCIYHYWFRTGSQLLEKPMEILLNHPEIDTKYCICWANETWKRTWYSEKKEILKFQEYGKEEEWINHYEYLSQFFKDKRYIKENNKPIVLIYHSADIEKLKEMRELWDRLAKDDGFNGVYIVSGNTGNIMQDNRNDCFDAYYNYEPGFTRKKFTSNIERIKRFSRNRITQIYNKFFPKQKKFSSIISSDDIYKNLTQITEYNNKKCYLGSFTSYDDTPRRQYNGDIYYTSPALFKKSLEDINDKLNELKRPDDYVFVTAWNEWGEGAHLEPDTNNGYKWLEAVEEVQSKNKVVSCKMKLNK